MVILYLAVIDINVLGNVRVHGQKFVIVSVLAAGIELAMVISDTLL